MQNDCGQPMCNVCTGKAPTFPCVGVIGAANQQQTGQANVPSPTDPVWTFGNKTAVPYLWSLGSDSTKQCSSSKGLGLFDSYGACIPAFGLNNDNLTQKSPLLVNADNFSKLVSGQTNVTTFPLQALHKIWGDSDGEFNKGVNSKNVYVTPTQENVSFAVKDANFTNLQSVLVMEAHGDKYSGTVPGLAQNGKKDASCFDASNNTFYQGDKKKCKTGDAVMPQCKNWVELDSSVPANNRRVGGVACTRGQYGPGVYNLLCYVPKTEDTSTDGRGYVFAIWPFHYEEMYANGIQKVDDTQAPCFEECDGADAVDATCPSKGCVNGVDLFSIINHEIDIEIPTNSPQLDWTTQMTWDTMNCNTWLSDINNYDQNTGAYYSQVSVKNTGGNFISSEPESSTKKDYHWYTLDWYVDPSGDLTKNYVAFYFDDPFDPSGTTPIMSFGSMLPKAPSGNPVFKTNRFVPTRSGRLNFGPWMGWWGYNAKNGGVPNFDTAKVRMAQMSITPYSNLWDASGKYLLPDFPQSYDQKGVLCDFQDMVQPPNPGPGPGPSPNPDPNPSTKTTSSGFPIWAIVVIILGAIVLSLIIWGITDAVKRKKNRGLNLKQ